MLKHFVLALALSLRFGAAELGCFGFRSYGSLRPSLSSTTLKLSCSLPCFHLLLSSAKRGKHERKKRQERARLLRGTDARLSLSGHSVPPETTAIGHLAMSVVGLVSLFIRPSLISVVTIKDASSGAMLAMGSWQHRATLDFEMEAT